MKKKYKKPQLKKTRIKLNFFYTDSRYLESLDLLQSSHLLTQSCGISVCFLTDTRIKLSNGYLKKIQDIKENDEIISYNLQKKQIINNKVKVLSKKTSKSGYLIINNKLNITHEHRVWVNNEEWKAADKIAIGDTLMDSNERTEFVKSIQYITGNFDVYNIHIEGQEHNFFAEDILVHNQASSGVSS